MKRRPVTRKSTCVDLNLPISNPSLACEQCVPFLDVTVKTRKSARDVKCLQPWSIKRWGDHREIRKIQKCKKVREYLGLGEEDTNLIEEVDTKRTCCDYNPIVKLKYDWNLHNKKEITSSPCDNRETQQKALLELAHVMNEVDRNIVLFEKLSHEYATTFAATPPPLSLSKQSIKAITVYFGNENRGEGVSKRKVGNENSIINCTLETAEAVSTTSSTSNASVPCLSSISLTTSSTSLSVPILTPSE